MEPPPPPLYGRRIAATVMLALLGAQLVLWIVIVVGSPVPAASEVLRPALFLAGVALAIYGICARAYWGRWLAQGIALGGLVQLGVLIYYLGPWWLLMGLPIAVVLAALYLLLLGRRMSELYERSDSSRNRWNLELRPVRVLATAIVLNIGAVPMLLTYLWSEAWWIGAGQRAATLFALLALVVALVLVIRQRTAGLLLLGLAGAAMVALAVVALAGALGPVPPELERGGCSMTPKEVALAGSIPAVAASIPGALSAVLALAGFAARIRSFLRRPAR